MSRWRYYSALRRRRWELKQQVERERSFPYYSRGGLGPDPVAMQMQDVQSAIWRCWNGAGSEWHYRANERWGNLRKQLAEHAYKLRCRRQEAILRACYVVPTSYPESGVAWLCGMGGQDAHEVAAKHGLPKREEEMA